MNKDYFLIMERPLGSHTWTFAAISLDPGTANEKAVAICEKGNTCTYVVTAQLPCTPDKMSRYAALCDESGLERAEGGAK